MNQPISLQNTPDISILYLIGSQDMANTNIYMDYYSIYISCNKNFN